MLTFHIGVSSFVLHRNYYRKPYLFIHINVNSHIFVIYVTKIKNHLYQLDMIMHPTYCP